MGSHHSQLPIAPGIKSQCITMGHWACMIWPSLSSILIPEKLFFQCMFVCVHVHTYACVCSGVWVSTCTHLQAPQKILHLHFTLLCLEWPCLSSLHGSFIIILFKKIIYLLFLAVLGLHCCLQALCLVAASTTLHCSARASHCSDFSCCGAQALEFGFSSCGAWA